VPAPESVRQFVNRFEENLDSYRSSRYNETQLRREFLDPLFEALGWDVFNEVGYAEAYKDVFHEDSLEIQRMLKLHKSPSARTPQQKERVKRKIESTDRAIDRLVYELSPVISPYKSSGDWIEAEPFSVL